MVSSGCGLFKIRGLWFGVPKFRARVQGFESSVLREQEPGILCGAAEDLCMIVATFRSIGFAVV